MTSVSIIISCFNYERFVGDAIASALGQQHPGTEVIVVDDGSTDRSAAVIGAHSGRVTALSQPNSGQAAALNAGYAASRGDAVLFLDADDVLLPGAAAALSRVLAGAEIAKAHWSMPVIDAAGERTGEIQDPELPEGDLRSYAIEHGPLSDMTMPSPPMSGNAFARWYLRRVMPVPAEHYRTGADEYLFGLAPAFGPIARLESQSLYRIHGRNDHLGQSFEERLAFQERHNEIIAEVVARECGVGDADAWRRHSWWMRAGRVACRIEAAVPAGERVALIDQGALGIDADLRGRTVVPFPDACGQFAGVPESDVAARAELEHLAGHGVGYVAVAWPAYWWLEEYPSLARALRARPALGESDDVMLFGPAEERT